MYCPIVRVIEWNQISVPLLLSEVQVVVDYHTRLVMTNADKIIRKENRLHMLSVFYRQNAKRHNLI